MKQIFLSVALAAFALIVVACGYSKVKGERAVICNQQYALCTSAQCIPDPDRPGQSICFCEVHDGKSLGLTSCDKRIAKTDKLGIRHVISTFSFNDFETKKNMTCPSGKPWSNCLDKPCVVDPLDPSKAICFCSIVRTGAFQTFGGDCDRSKCDNGYWSGATPEANSQSVHILMKALGQTQSTQKFCPK